MRPRPNLDCVADKVQGQMNEKGVQVMRSMGNLEVREDLVAATETANLLEEAQPFATRMSQSSEQRLDLGSVALMGHSH